jgi:hypothetical protein
MAQARPFGHTAEFHLTVALADFTLQSDEPSRSWAKAGGTGVLHEGGGELMELREALVQISEIRQQMARTEVFRGYRALPVAFSGLLAFAAAFAQAVLLRDPASQIVAYVGLWTGAAVLSACAAGLEMVIRARVTASSLGREITCLAVEQFIPCLAAGALLTIVLMRAAPESLWMLPGLWQVLFSLGVFASCRLLPRATFGVAVFYLAAGMLTLALARGEFAFSPWAMGVPFGVGQFYAAVVLYTTLECHDGQS